MARKELVTRDDWKALYPTIPDQMSFEKTMVGHLAENPGDWAGAIDSLPKNLQMMFVHAYQSILFNKMLSRRMEHGLPLNLPTVGDIIVPLDANRNPLHEDPILTTAKNIDLVTRQVRAGRAYVTIALFGKRERPCRREMGGDRKVRHRRGRHQSRGLPLVPASTTAVLKEAGERSICPVRDLEFRPEEDGYTYSSRFQGQLCHNASCVSS